MPSLILSVLVGSALGAALGYFGQCTSGTCPLTSTWWRGALYGAGLGLVFYMTSGVRGSGSMNQSTVNVKHISEAEFEAEVAQAASPVVADFYAPWCGSCKTLAPIVEELAGQFVGKVKFVKINVDEASGLARRFEVQGAPTLLFFKGGKVADTQVGSSSKDALKARVQSLAGS